VLPGSTEEVVEVGGAGRSRMNDRIIREGVGEVTKHVEVPGRRQGASIQPHQLRGGTFCL
jgi:hypothetical protein